MSTRIAYDINPLNSIALTVAILIGGHPHPMPRSIIEKSLLHATRPTYYPQDKIFHSADGGTFVRRLKRRLKFRYLTAI